ncbi:MAG: PSD1 domain-containing protein [Planctomycetales bacterium]|nr:PSD1 domain-containing protein [Planctomycetales bacterium]
MFKLPRFALWCLLATCSSACAEERSDELTFERHIRPILRAHCLDCHGAGEELAGGLDLRLVRFMERGGESGAAIAPGDVANSLLLQRVIDGEMPPGNHPVPPAEIEKLKAWVASGAKTSRTEPLELGPGLEITPEEREYWAFHPIQRPSVPVVKSGSRVRTPIDAFLLRELEANEISFAADADKVTLVRRAYLDLIGLPPTPEQVDAFVADERPDAWEQLIDSLLDSPQYGERWGRHWLDVAGYADSDGAERDDVRAWAFRYRDWVIRAFNQDMPFDEFIRWQLAGDELVSRPLKDLSPLQIDQLTATGYLRMASDGTAAKNDDEARNQVVADTIKIVSTSLLGLSVGCAQCHDHRYDPISHIDYFRLRAVFEPALNYRQWSTPGQRLVSLMTDEQTSLANTIETEAQVKVSERTAKQAEFMEAALQSELGKFDADLHSRLEAAYRAAADQRSDEQKALLETYPSIGKLHPGVLYQYNQKAADELKAIDQQIAEIRAKKPTAEFVHALVEPTDTPAPTTQLFHRGDYRQPRFEVMPGGLTAAAPEDSPFAIAADDTTLPTTGRRLAYARWLTNGRHPLVARVLVNRFWLHHFGTTFVATPDEFGKLGAPPTRPDLLDWLADEFMTHNWSLKHLHRMIMKSTVYRQQAIGAGQSLATDPSNQLYSRFPVHRLEAEAIRDAILCVADRLDTTSFGPPVDVTADETGQIVVGGEKQRRSVYLQVRRSMPVALLETFDAPVMEVNCGKRTCSTVAPQSLMLLNSDFIRQSAEALAKRVLAFELNSVASRLQAIWRIVYGRLPTDEELAAAEQFLSEQESLFTTRKIESPTHQAWVDLAQSLLSSNEFLYLE